MPVLPRRTDDRRDKSGTFDGLVRLALTSAETYEQVIDDAARSVAHVRMKHVRTRGHFIVSSGENCAHETNTTVTASLMDADGDPTR